MLDHLAAGGRIAGLATLSTAFLLGTTAEADAQDLRTVTMSRQQTSEESLEVDLEFGAGRFNVAPAESGLLYRIEMRYDQEAVEPSVDYEDGHLVVGLDRRNRGIRLGRNVSDGELSLALTPNALLDLDLEFGAVRADLELGGLSMTRLSLATGASESRVRISRPNPVPMERARIEAGAARFEATDLGNLNAAEIDIDAGLGEIVLDFGGEWRRDAEVEIDIGVGSLELVFPRGLGVRIDDDSFLTSLDPQELIRRGDAYFSSDWETAERRVTVRVDSALSNVKVRWRGQD